MRLPIYLDYMATTPVDPRVVAKMQQYLTIDVTFGNPSSPHFYGYAAKTAIDEAKEQVAALLNANPSGLIWTSGATEANNLAIKGCANFYQRQGKHIITCTTEHKSVLEPCRYLATQGFQVTYINPESDGLINLQKLEQLCRSDTILIAIMHVNNEIGVIQNIAAIGELTRSKGILFHVDAAQSMGKIPINLEELKIDSMAVSAHKIYGPKGVGALYIRQNPKLHLEPQMHGGEQESGLRSGTLATHQIMGMGKAAEIAAIEMATENKRLLTLREKFWDGIKELPGVSINGTINQRIAGNLNVSFGEVDGETLILGLKDIAVSSASACNKNYLEPSYVLQALRIDHTLAMNAMRFSFGRFTTTADIDYAVQHINMVVKQLHPATQS